MLNLYISVIEKNITKKGLSKGERLSVIYHNMFDFTLSLADLIRWRASDDLFDGQAEVVSTKGYFVVDGREGLIYQRLLRKRLSAKKMEIAKKASEAISFLPFVKMVAVTGSLAMENATDKSDIDLMIVTKSGTLWTSRALSYLFLKLLNFRLRKPFDKNEKDKLCLNVWLDETSLDWKKRNIYTAHEIAQIVPLVNKDRTYEKLLYKNKWILSYWPNSVRIKKIKCAKPKNPNWPFTLIEKTLYKIQHLYMRGKITNEIVSSDRALFHPQDWSKVVLDRLKTLLVE